ncbi:MAG TPA: hypothetical protein VHM26_08100 [Chitinophagaceae bacterium]|jgi:hypothetical protein|nr:hypothetical protein [Chitinophagaceae bacterium]
MKIATLLAVVCANIIVFTAGAQEIPKGFKQASLVLADSSTLSGSIKDNMKGSASILFQPSDGSKKKTYSGSELIAVKTTDATYACIKGDFFKVLCEGDLCFLQKVSDASGMPSYNGTEAVFNNGTEGKLNDYFTYDRKNKSLQLVSKKNKEEVIKASFSNCATLQQLAIGN